jgi:hypothetical protein
MNNREIYNIAKENIGKLKFSYSFKTGSENPYEVGDLNKLRHSILEFEEIPFLKNDIDTIKNGFLFTNTGDKLGLNGTEHTQISDFVKTLKIGTEFLIKQFESNYDVEDETSIAIKLPPLTSFSDLSKVATDFKKAIEIPLLDSKIESDLNIKTAEPGSIWLMVGVGTTIAVNLIGGIAWAAAVIKRKNAEANIFTQHARTLELKNEQIELYVDAQKTQLENVLQNEAEAIAAKHYSAQEPETIERLKLSISTVADLIEKGAKILPTSKSDDVKQLFPEYGKLSLIESAIKKISEN